MPPSKGTGVDREFARISARVLRATRKRLSAIARGLPAPLDEEVSRVFMPYVDRNLLRDPPRNIVIAVAYDQGIRDLETLVQLSVATAVGGLHSLLLDDLVDNKEAAGRPWYDIYVAHVLYVLHQDCLQRIGDVKSFSRYRDTVLDVQLDTYSALIEEEKFHVGVPTVYRSPEIVWRKCSPVKGVLERVLAISGSYKDQQPLNEAADLACFALCTLDDMLDWPMDYAQRRFTYVIQSALDVIGQRWTEDAADDFYSFVSFELVYGVTHHRLMAEVLEALERAISVVTPVSQQLAMLLQTSLAAARASWERHLQYLATVEHGLTAAS